MCALVCCGDAVNPEAQSAKELLLMASSAEEQKLWVQRLSKRITRKGIIQSQQQTTTTMGPGGDKLSVSG